MKLIIFKPIGDLPSASPFCVKSMLMLSYANIEHEIEYVKDLKISPTGKLPVLIDEGQIISDSSAIYRHIQKKYGVDFEEGLSELDKAATRSLIRLAEEHLRFILVNMRWSIDENFMPFEASLKNTIPFPLNKFVPSLIRKTVLKSIKAQGIGRMNEAEQVLRFEEDLRAITYHLGDKRFLFGDQISLADFSVEPVLAALYTLKAECEMMNVLDKFTRLKTYHQNVQNELYKNIIKS